MRKMKNSGIEWIGEIPEDWEVGRIGELYTERKEKVSDKDFMPLSVTMKGILPQLASAAKSDAHDDRKLVRKGDFAINSRSDRRGSCGISDYDGSVSLINTILTPRNNMNPNYYNWLFHTTLFADEFYKWGHGIVDDLWTTNWSDMKNITIPVPLVTAQQRIADFLDDNVSQIDSVISKTRETIEEYKKLKQSIITEVVTGKVKIENEKVCGKYDTYKDSGIEWIGEIPSEWKITKIKHEGIARNGLTYTPTDVCDNEEGELVLRSSNIQNNKLILDDCVFVNTKINNELYVKENDILICSRNGSPKLIGKNALIPANLRASFGAFMLIYRCKIPFYIRLVLNSDIFSYYLGNFLTVSVNQLTIGNFNEIQFPLPPKQEQDKILMYLNRKCSEIDKLITKKEQLVLELESYKKSLIYEVVTGKKEI